jgi:hypothetical protein
MELGPLNRVVLNGVQNVVGITKFNLLYSSVPLRFSRGSSDACPNGGFYF